jgi:hypothetical protein
MGMMYWTATGIFENIKKRNTTMWTANKQSALTKLWSNSLSESVESRLARSIDHAKDSSGGMLKTFMPNFVMIDFADAAKCMTIHDLNSVAASALTAAWKKATAEDVAVAGLPILVAHGRIAAGGTRGRR